MMTNVLLGDYPDVFKAGAAFMGVPFGCFATTDGSVLEQRLRQRPASSRPRSSGATWCAAPTPATPARGRGCSCGTAPTDTTLRYPNFGEEIKQWTNVLGVSQTPVLTDTPAVRLDPHPVRQHRHQARSRRSASPASGTACR